MVYDVPFSANAYIYNPPNPPLNACDEIGQELRPKFVSLFFQAQPGWNI